MGKMSWKKRDCSNPYVDLSTKNEISGIIDYMRVFSDKVLSVDEILSYYKCYYS